MFGGLVFKFSDCLAKFYSLECEKWADFMGHLLTNFLNLQMLSQYFQTYKKTGEYSTFWIVWFVSNFNGQFVDDVFNLCRWDFPGEIFRSRWTFAQAFPRPSISTASFFFWNCVVKNQSQIEKQDNQKGMWSCKNLSDIGCICLHPEWQLQVTVMG